MNPVENKLKMLMLMFMLQIVMTSMLVWGVTPCTRDLEWYTHTHTHTRARAHALALFNFTDKDKHSPI